MKVVSISVIICSQNRLITIATSLELSQKEFRWSPHPYVYQLWKFEDRSSTLWDIRGNIRFFHIIPKVTISNVVISWVSGRRYGRQFYTKICCHPLRGRKNNKHLYTLQQSCAAYWKSFRENSFVKKVEWDDDVTCPSCCTLSTGATTVAEHVSWVGDTLWVVGLSLTVLISIHVHTVCITPALVNGITFRELPKLEENYDGYQGAANWLVLLPLFQNQPDVFYVSDSYEIVWELSASVQFTRYWLIKSWNSQLLAACHETALSRLFGIHH